MEKYPSTYQRTLRPRSQTSNLWKTLLGLLLIPLMSTNFGCLPNPTSGRGFTLPEGDVKQGEVAFKRLHCNACHSVPGVDQLPSIVDADSPEVSVSLGGKVSRIKTYGELVSAIINPSHRLATGYAKDEIATEQGDSKMPTYNETMTVQELTDIVMFLQSKYKLKPYEPTHYPLY